MTKYIENCTHCYLVSCVTLRVQMGIDVHRLLIKLVFYYVLSFDGLKTMDAFASYYLVDVKKPLKKKLYLFKCQKGYEFELKFL